jgi:hypothetical protein
MWTGIALPTCPAAVPSKTDGGRDYFGTARGQVWQSVVPEPWLSVGTLTHFTDVTTICRLNILRAHGRTKGPQVTALQGSTPRSLVGVYRIFEGAYCFLLQDQRVSQSSTRQVNTSVTCCLAHSSILKMEAVHSSETSVILYTTLQELPLFTCTGVTTSAPCVVVHLAFIIRELVDANPPHNGSYVCCRLFGYQSNKMLGRQYQVA